MLAAAFLSYFGNVLALAFSAIGVGIGQGLAAEGVLEGQARQTMGGEQSFRTFVIGLALTESGAILALVVVLTSLVNIQFPISLGSGLADLGAGLAIGIAAGVVGVASSLAVRHACLSISRQPLFTQKITTFMLLIQSIVEAPVIFAFIIALILKATVNDNLSVVDGIRYFSGGLVIALGCIGPAIGQAIFVSSACKSVGLNKSAYNKIFPFSMLSEAIIETPVIFSFVISFLLIYHSSSNSPMMASLASFGAAIAMGVGAIGTGISTGNVAASGCRSIAERPHSYGSVLRNSLVSQAIIESAAIYSLIVALFLVFSF